MASVSSSKVSSIVSEAKKSGKTDAQIKDALKKAGISQDTSGSYVGPKTPATKSTTTSKTFMGGDPGIIDNPAAYWSKINAKGETVRDTTAGQKITTPTMEWVDMSALDNVEWGDAVKNILNKYFWSNASILKDLETQMNDKNGLLTQRVMSWFSKAEQTRAIGTLRNKKIEDSFGLLESWLWEKYQDIMDRISKQESLVDSKFWEMKTNLETIKTGFQADQEAGDQAASIAASRQMRWIGWASGQIIGSGLWQSRARTSMLNMAKLDTQLAGEANKLNQNYLELKNQIMSDANLSDGNRMEILNKLNDKFGAVAELQAGTEKQFINEINTPITQTQDAMLNAKIGQWVNDANNKWMNTSPDMRQSQVQQILWTALSSWVNLPSSVVANASGMWTTTEMMNYLYNYIINNVPKARQNANWIQWMLAALQSWSTNSVAN